MKMEPNFEEEDDEIRYIVRADENIQFVINKKEGNNVLQLLFHPQASIFFNLKSLCWSSDFIKMKLNGNYFLSMESDIATLVNESEIMATAAISNGQNGDFTVVNLEASQGIYVTKDTFLCVTTNSEINSTKFPIKRFHVLTSFLNPYFLLSNRVYMIKNSATSNDTENNNNNNNLTTKPCSVFLQDGCNIMMKSLESGESINISYSCLVAVDTTCQLSETQVSSTSTPIVLMLKIEGPGNVYFSTAGKRSIHTASRNGFGGYMNFAGGPIGGLNRNFGNHPILAMLHLVVFILALTLLIILYTQTGMELYNLVVNQRNPLIPHGR